MNKRTEELRAELAALDDNPSETEQTYASPKQSTREFIDYRMERIWTKMPDPKPSLEKWLRSAEAKALIRRHDEAIARRVRQVRTTDYKDLRGNQSDDLRMAESEYSWNWEHLRWGSGCLFAVPDWYYELQA